MWPNFSQRDKLVDLVTSAVYKRSLCKSEMHLQIDTPPQLSQLRGLVDKVKLSTPSVANDAHVGRLD